MFIKHMRLFALVGFIFLAASGMAQDLVLDKEIEFKSTTFDFGTKPFGKEKINAVFIFTNNSNVNFQIKDVVASCGCTVPSWPKTVIEPGKVGVITAQFDPTNLAGEVDKSIEVIANYRDIMVKVLKITGILEKPRNVQQPSNYPGQYGYMRQSYYSLGFGDVSNAQKVTRTVQFVNDYTDPMYFNKVVKAPEYLEVVIEKDSIIPGDTVDIHLTIDGSKVNDYGLVNGEFQILTTDIMLPVKSVKFGFNATMDFSRLKKKRVKKAPMLSVSQNQFDFGIMKEGAKSTQRFTISNHGKTPLSILKVSTPCGCTSTDLQPDVLAPGESKTVSLTFDSIFMNGQVNRDVTLYTNDPNNHVYKLYVSATVLSH